MTPPWLSSITISFLKGRIAHGTLGFFVSPLAIYGGLPAGQARLPLGAALLRRAQPRQAARSEVRFNPSRRTERFKEGLRDAVGGSTEERYDEKIAERGEEPRS